MDILNGYEELFRKYANIVEENAKQNLSWTNNLKNNVSVSGDVDGVKISMPLYGVFIDKGTKPHTIKSKNLPYLHFKAPWGWVKTKEVKHPGTSAQPWIEESLNLDEFGDELIKLITSNIRESLK